MKNNILYIFIIKIILLSVATNSFGQIVKVSLTGNNQCNNRLDVNIFVRASDFSNNNFEIGSSSFFFNYDPEVVNFLSYTPFEFDASTSNTAAAANWINQAVSADNECGIIHIVLQKEEGGAANYVLDQNNNIQVGRFTMEFVNGEADPDIVINPRFTLFNSGQPNDGTAMAAIEDYPKVLQYTCDDDCTYPVVNNITTNDASCSQNDGLIALSFPDAPNRTNIEFSIDNGFSYSFNTLDDVGTYEITGLASGDYDLWVRWGNDACPYALGPVFIGTAGGAEADFTTTSSCSGESEGTITLIFPDHPTRTGIEFSIDGGLNYPFFTQDSVGTYDITGLAVGTYDLWVRWGDDSCPVNLPDPVIYADTPPEVEVRDYNICGTATTGSIQFDFTDIPNRTNIEFSIDGGQTYPYNVLDSDLSFTVDNLPIGTYNCWTRWGNDDCPVDLGNAYINNGEAPTATVTRDNACVDSDEGEIIFEFPDHPNRTGIAFSIDGGASYQYTGDDVGTYTFTDLAPGTYDCWVKWGNSDCPVSLGTQTIGTHDLPVATATHTNTCPTTSEGSITISFTDHPSRTGIAFSINGGAAYQYTTDDAGTYQYDGLSAGTYSVWTMWGDGDCQTFVGDVVIQADSNLPNCEEGGECVTDDVPVTIRARGNEGAEIMILRINEEDVQTWTVSTEWTDYTYTHQGGIYQLQVHFTNDVYEPGVVDHNLFVDYVTLGTQTIETNAPSTYGTAVRIGDQWCQAGYDFEPELLACAGYFEYYFGSPVTIHAKGDEGPENMTLEINEVDVAVWESIGTTWQDFTMYYYGEIRLFRVHLSNHLYIPADGIDYNLGVDYVTANGKTIQTDAPSTYGTRVLIDGSYCVAGYNFVNEKLYCAGYFEYDFSTPITIHARGNEGAEIMILQINEEDIQTWTVGTDWADYTASYYGNINQLRVYFTNDLYEPGVLDHNLDVDYIIVDTETMETNAPSTYGTAVRIGDQWCQAGYDFEIEKLACEGYFEYINNCGSNGGNKVDEQQIPTFTLHPNPARDFVHINIELDNAAHNGMIEVYDMNGKYLYEQEVTANEMTVSVQRLPEGMYLLRLRMNDGTQAVQRFVKL